MNEEAAGRGRVCGYGDPGPMKSLVDQLLLEYLSIEYGPGPLPVLSWGQMARLNQQAVEPLPKRGGDCTGNWIGIQILHPGVRPEGIIGLVVDYLQT